MCFHSAGIYVNRQLHYTLLHPANPEMYRDLWHNVWKNVRGVLIFLKNRSSCDSKLSNYWEMAFFPCRQTLCLGESCFASTSSPPTGISSCLVACPLPSSYSAPAWLPTYRIFVPWWPPHQAIRTPGPGNLCPCPLPCGNLEHCKVW